MARSRGRGRRELKSEINIVPLLDVLLVLLLIFMAIMAIEGYITGRRINRAVGERFPNFEGGGFKLGWYTFMRTTQLRKMRVPRPRVSVGDAV